MKRVLTDMKVKLESLIYKTSKLKIQRLQSKWKIFKNDCHEYLRTDWNHDYRGIGITCKVG